MSILLKGGRTVNTIRIKLKFQQLRRIAGDVEQVIAKFRVIYDNTRLLDFDSYSARDESKVAPTIRVENVVGFEEEAKILTRYVNEESEELDIIAIVGMAGAGKTTLAWKIYRDPLTSLEFPILIWVDVGEELRMRDIFLTILTKFTSEDMYSKSEPELAQQVACHLEREKFLIVMDGVWTVDDWNKLQLALPKGNRKGKVLITSCKEDVARIANHTRDPYRLSFLSHEESWKLLQLEVFGKLDVCPDELKPLGKLIAEQCGGLPIAIVVMADVIVNEWSQLTDMGARRHAWMQVCKTMHVHLNRRSYNELPVHLRACFLYFGMFPEDYEIPAWRLIRMWIAEGFVVARDGMSYEETARDYLEDLVNRSLVLVQKRKADGGIKTCRIHGTLHEFCKIEGGKERENIFHEIKHSGDAGSDSISSQLLTNRRLCIHSNVLDFLSSRPYSPQVRSFVTFAKNEVNLPPECSEAVTSAFGLVRVLDVKPIRFTKIHRLMFQLVHLRYLVLTFTNVKVLPPALNNLWNLQTLVVYTTSPALEIEADIWQLSQFRHLKTNASTTLLRIGKSSKDGGQLQTLGAISPECCTKEFLERGRNLKKLGVRGKLSLLLQGNTDFFEGFGRLSDLQKLKLVNEAVLDKGKLHDLHLPPPYKFPPNLRSLTLSRTCLNWTKMSILGMIYHLEVLKLKDKAFNGSKWEASDGGFHSLEVLHIEGTDLVVWEASAHHFPRLRRLNLWNCEKLQQVPIGVADIPSLQHLDLYNTELAAASAKKIHEAKKILKDEGIQLGAFELSISPPS